MSNSEPDFEQLGASIARLEGQRAALGDSVVDAAVAALRSQLRELQKAKSAVQSADERKLVTILFADIAGFTALSETIDPEEVHRLINACFDRLVPLVEKYEGTIDKFIGDEIMALFGAPVTHEDDPERALHAAMEMMEAIQHFNRDFGTNLGIHMGINTGRVVAGRVGTENRRDYSVMGDAVNLAARLEAASQAGEIFVGAATYRATEALFDFDELPPLTLKGKQAPVAVYRLIAAKAKARRRRGVEGLQAPLTGREREIAQIQERLAGLKASRGCVVSIVGEAGLGKSRLIAETRSLVAKHAVAAWAEGRALSYTTGRSYWLARDLLRNLLGVATDAPPSAVAAALSADLARSFGERIVEYYPYLAQILELSLESEMQDKVKFLSGEALQSRIAEAFHACIQKRIASGPLVLVWEDLHWSDPSSLQLLEKIAPLVLDRPLLLICAARPDESRAVEIIAQLNRVHSSHGLLLQLEPLSEGESTSLICSLLKMADLPAELRDLIVARADGNPFYVEELLRSLIDSGALVLEANGPKFVRDVDAVEIPDTLREVLSARIDRLQPDDKSVLQKAAVIGRIFGAAVLARLRQATSSGAGGLAEALRELERREFILSNETEALETGRLPDDEFIFKHAVTHEVAYESLLVSVRKQLHALTGRTLEQLFPDRLHELAPVLAHHFECAEVMDRAVLYLQRAAERAKATFANEEAISYYQSAARAHAQLLKTKETSAGRQAAAAIQECLGDLFCLTGQQNSSRESFNRAFAFLDDDHIRRARMRRKMGVSHSLERHYNATEQAFRAAERELEGGDATHDRSWWEEMLQIQLDRMHLFYWQDQVAQMSEVAARWRDAIETNATRTQRTKFLKLQALASLMGSRFRPPRECVELAERAVAASDGIPDLSEACYVRFTLCLIQTFAPDPKEAIRWGKSALELARRVGDLVLQARCLTYIGLAHRRAGNVERAREFARNALALALKLQMTEYVAMATANLAWVALNKAELDDAEKLGKEALARWHAMEDPMSFDWIALWPLLEIALERNRYADAIEAAEGMLAQNQSPLDDETMAVTAAAIDCWKRGATAAAATQLKLAVETARRHGYL
jgi:predicted ATPase/class 3 adenylate cyclase